MTFPYTPVPVDSGMSFVHNDTGETLHFDSSWFGHLDRVEQILWQNHTGDYDVVYPIGRTQNGEWIYP